MTKLQDIRKARGISQTQLAAAIGVGKQVIQAYEQGRRDINKAQGITLYKLAKALDVRMIDIMELEEAEE